MFLFRCKYNLGRKSKLETPDGFIRGSDGFVMEISFQHKCIGVPDFPVNQDFYPSTIISRDRVIHSVILSRIVAGG